MPNLQLFYPYYIYNLLTKSADICFRHYRIIIYIRFTQALYFQLQAVAYPSAQASMIALVTLKSENVSALKPLTVRKSGKIEWQAPYFSTGRVCLNPRGIAASYYIPYHSTRVENLHGIGSSHKALSKMKSRHRFIESRFTAPVRNVLCCHDGVRLYFPSTNSIPVF